MEKVEDKKTLKLKTKKEKIEKNTKTVKIETKTTSKKTAKTLIKKTVKKPVIAKVEDLDLDQEKGKKIHPPTENNPDENLARLVIEDSLVKRHIKESLKHLKKEPTTMEELLALPGYEIQGLKKGESVVATITDKGKRSLFFDIGAKTEGILIEKEMEYVSDYIDYLQIGDTVMAIVVSPENDKGQILLSLRRAANDWRWRLFNKYQETGQPIEVRGLDVNRGGMIARVLNVRGFIPVSQFGRKWMGKLDQLYNKVFPVKIIEVDKEKNRLIFSEKAVSESDMMDKQQAMLKSVKIGGIYKGEVSGVMPFGIFVRVLIDGVKGEETFLDGLVHISEISWEKVNDVATHFKVGEKVDVQVLDIDQNSEKLNLSIKRLQSDPWDEISTKYPVDAKIKGKITRMAPYGAFVEIEKGIEGLIHISKLPSETAYKADDKVDVYVESIDSKSHRISLGVVLSAKPVGYK
jgi:small subunit ribosomal protein S1